MLTDGSFPDPFGDERRFTKTEISDRVEIGVIVSLEKERNSRLQRDLIKALDSNRDSDPFGGGLDDSAAPLQKMARGAAGTFGLRIRSRWRGFISASKSHGFRTSSTVSRCS